MQIPLKVGNIPRAGFPVAAATLWKDFHNRSITTQRRVAQRIVYLKGSPRYLALSNLALGQSRDEKPSLGEAICLPLKAMECG